MLTIKDDEMVSAIDLNSNCLFREADIGKKTRARAACDILKNQSPKSNINTFEKEITLEFIQQYNIVIFTEFYMIDDLIKYNNCCRENQNKDMPGKRIGFIWAGVIGYFLFIFNDFGLKFKIYNKTDEDPLPLEIKSISNSNPGVVTLKTPHNFSKTDFVKIDDVEGMTEVNGNDVRPIQVLDKYSFSIEDTKEFSQYQWGGYAEKAKVPFYEDFMSLLESLDDPFDSEIIGNLGISNQKMRFYHFHLFVLTMCEFFKINKKCPEHMNQMDINTFSEIFKEINMRNKEKEKEGKVSVTLENIDETRMAQLASINQAQIMPLCSFAGGIIGLETLKFVGKLTPMKRFFYFDCSEAAPLKKTINLNGVRKEYQVMLFGNALQEVIQNLQYSTLIHFICELFFVAYQLLALVPVEWS